MCEGIECHLDKAEIVDELHSNSKPSEHADQRNTSEKGRDRQESRFKRNIGLS